MAIVRLEGLDQFAKKKKKIAIISSEIDPGTLWHTS
jgi:hypothetical protein